jgi:riboflavin synthase
VFTGPRAGNRRLAAPNAQGSGFRLDIEAPFGPLELGESVSVNGACLTVTATDAQGFSADVSIETHERTTLGEVPVGQALNLERALTAGDRLGGHLVTGHVDGVARVAAVSREGEALRVVVEPPAELCRFIAEKGSVTLDGVSLTVNRTSGATFEIMLIPHTLSVTNLERAEPGRKLNLEVDLLARYVVRYLEATAGAERGLDATLRRAGYLS